MGGPPFRFMLPQQGLGEHPLSPGMPLLISAAINQFSPSHQPHIHPPHLVLPFLSTSLLPLGSFYSALVCSPQRFSALNRSRGRLRLSWPTSTFLFDVNGAGFFCECLKSLSAWSEAKKCTYNICTRLWAQAVHHAKTFICTLHTH